MYDDIVIIWSELRVNVKRMIIENGIYHLIYLVFDMINWCP